MIDIVCIFEVCDLLIEVGYVVLIELYVVVLEDYVVVICGSEIIVILLCVEVCVCFVLMQIVLCLDVVLMLGLVNVYIYNLMILLCGVVDDLLLMVWLQQYIWLVEVVVIGLEFVVDGIMLVIVEMLCGGIICVNENYFFFDVQVVVYKQYGFCVLVGVVIIDFFIVWVKIDDEYFVKVGELYDQWCNDLLIGILFVLYVLYIVNDVNFECVCMLFDQLDMQVYLYMYEIVQEISDLIKLYGQCLLVCLDCLGLVNDCLIVVYMIQFIEVEIYLCVECGVSVVYCFEFNFKLVFGFCLVCVLQCVGVNLVIGIDGCVSNNDLDMFSENCIVVIFVKVVVNDVIVLDVVIMLCVVILGGVCVLGFGDCIGLIEVGKQVDLVCVDLFVLEIQLFYYVFLQFVYVVGCYQVSDVWIVGQFKLVQCELVGMDMVVIVVNVCQWCECICYICV